MRTRGIPKIITDWISLKLATRRTTLVFDDFRSPPQAIISGIDQGCTLSVICFQYYNADLISIGANFPGIYVNLNIDDSMAISIGDSAEQCIRQLHDFMTAPGGALEWAERHNSLFALDKFGLVNFSPSGTDLGPPLVIPGQIIQPASHHKFLGVLIDFRLKFREHTAKAVEKGTKWLNLFRRMARPNSGLTSQMIRTLYLSMAVPAMLYAADIFLTPIQKRPGRKTRYGSVGAIRKLTTVHRQALLLITGALRTTATDVMEAHCNIPPLHILLDQVCANSATRLASLPETHPLHSHVRQARRYVRRHRAPMHELLHAYQIDPRHAEPILPVRLHPAWAPPFTVSIARWKEMAIIEERDWSERPGLRAYSDGSDFQGGVGAAAVLYSNRQTWKKTLQMHMGPSSKHTVYEAEIVGILLALHLIYKSTASILTCSIGVDNQATLHALNSRGARPGHYLLDRVLTAVKLCKTKHPRMKLTLRWVPGHVGIKGNEFVDARAKEAAEGISSEKLPKSVSKLLQSSSKTKQSLRASFKKKFEQHWMDSDRWPKSFRIDPSLPSKKFNVLIASLPRAHASLLFQLRSGHVPLRKHLHRIKRADSPICPACHQFDETVHHFLFRCKAYEQERDQLKRELGRNAASISHLLSKPGSLRPLFRYIHATGRFIGLPQLAD